MVKTDAIDIWQLIGMQMQRRNEGFDMTFEGMTFRLTGKRIERVWSDTRIIELLDPTSTRSDYVPAPNALRDFEIECENLFKGGKGFVTLLRSNWRDLHAIKWEAIPLAPKFTPDTVRQLCGGRFPEETGFVWSDVEYFLLEDGIFQPYDTQGILPGPGLKISISIAKEDLV